MARRGVVIVSGGGAVSPFTTPSAGCASGLAAGSTDTGLRDALLGAGLQVWTSPANVGRGPVLADTEPNGFADPPEVLPEDLTVNSAGTIDGGGRRLAAFLTWLAGREGLTDLDVVAHSMGGLFARAAIRELRTAGHPLRIRSLTTLGTPWNGSGIADIAAGHHPIGMAMGDPATLQIVDYFRQLVADVNEGAGSQVTSAYLAGPDGWNARQGAQLDGIALTLVAGEWFRSEGGDAHLWPHDALVSATSALAVGVPAEVLPAHETHVFDDVHSIFFADQLGLRWDRGLTWDPDVMSVVLDALARS